LNARALLRSLNFLSGTYIYDLRSKTIADVEDIEMKRKSIFGLLEVPGLALDLHHWNLKVTYPFHR
jgi:hypothetical protein